jgi:hypothetical protein
VVGEREVRVRLRADVDQYSRAMREASLATTALGRNTSGLNGPLRDVEQQSGRTGKEIDKLSGRLRLATDAALILGPALIPLGAAAVGGLVALSGQLGATAGALGVTMLAVNGLGDALKAVDKYQLQPTAANFATMNAQLEKLGPSGRQFVMFLDEIEPDLKSLQTAARDGLLPGAEEGIKHLLELLPQVRTIITEIADELGSLADEAGAGLAGPKFTAFFNYLQTDAAPILADMGHTIGNLTEAVANLFVAFGGISGDFGKGLLSFSQDIAEASRHLDTNEGFQSFLDYVRTEGPHALETLGSLANAILQIVEATAPLGGPVLTVLGKFANIIAAIADSDLGTPIFAGLAALALYNRALAVTAGLQETAWGGRAIGSMKAFTAQLGTVTTAQDRARMSATELDAAMAAQSATFKGGLATIGKGAAVIGGLALATSGLTEQTGMSNTANLALMGTIAGPWGAAIGAGVGSVLDFKASYDSLNDSIDGLDAAIAGNSIPALTQQIADAKAQLDDLNHTSVGEGLLQGILGGVGAQGLAQQDLFGHITGQAGDLADKTAEAEKRLDDLRSGAAETFNPVESLAGAFHDAAKAAIDEAQALKDATDAMRAKRQEALRGVNAHLDYEQAIDDASKAIKENGKTVDDSTEKGRNNLRALYQLAGAWNEQSNAAKNAKGSLDSAKKGFIETATAMGMPIAQAKRLANQLFEIPPKRKTTIELDGADVAISKAQTLSQILASLHSKSITIALNYQTGQNKRPDILDQGGGSHADGGLIRGPGGPRDDRILARVSNREYIMQASAVDKYGVGMMDAINARRFADGGSPGGSFHSAIHGDGGGPAVRAWTDGVYSVAKALKAFKAELDAASKAIDKEKQKRDDLIAAESSFMQAVGGAYAKADLFSGGLSDFDTAVSANINDTEAAKAALATAAAHGLDGPLYQALAASGNLSLVQEFAGLSESEIAKREQQFAAQSNAQATLGSSAARAAGFTQAIKDVNREIRESNQERKHLAAVVKSLEQKLPKNVEDGARKGIAERDSRTAHRVRTGA